jgi:hypothetical protein
MNQLNRLSIFGLAVVYPSDKLKMDLTEINLK